jgi:hypothetical protein
MRQLDKSLAAAKPLPSYSELGHMFSYDPETGELRNKADRSSTAKAGDLAGSPNPRDGRVMIKIASKLYAASRIIWKIYYGYDPGGLVDHINLNPTDNRIVNLRVVSRSQNNANTTRKHSSPFGRGVRFHENCPRKPFSASIRIGGKNKSLGQFRTKEEAQAAFARAATELYGEYARVS